MNFRNIRVLLGPTIEYNEFTFLAKRQVSSFDYEGQRFRAVIQPKALINSGHMDYGVDVTQRSGLSIKLTCLERKVGRQSIYFVRINFLAYRLLWILIILVLLIEKSCGKKNLSLKQSCSIFESAANMNYTVIHVATLEVKRC